MGSSTLEERVICTTFPVSISSSLLCTSGDPSLLEDTAELDSLLSESVELELSESDSE